MKTWKGIIRSDLKEMKIGKDVAKDRNVWKVFHKSHASIENTLK